VLTGSVVSDLDVVVGPLPEIVIRRISECLEAVGLVPIMEWPYDLGQTLTVFLATVDGRQAMQLDMLNDSRALGKYAVKSEALLDRSGLRQGLSVVAPVDELVYLLRKRTVKGNLAALTDLRNQAVRFAPAEIDESIRSTLSSHGRRSVTALLRGDAGRREPRPVSLVLNLGRRLLRALRPTGFWVHCASAESAAAVLDRFGGYLPHAVSIGSARSPVALARLVVGRMQPGVVVTHGARPWMLSPDVVVGSESHDDACRRAVAVFRRRTERRLGVA
jgi:hypothetical protein